MTKFHRSALAGAAMCALLAGCAVAPPGTVALPSPETSASVASELPEPEAPTPTPVTTPTPDAEASTPAEAPSVDTPASASPDDPAMTKPTSPAKADQGRVGGGSGPQHGAYVVLSFDDCPASAGAFNSVVLAAEKLGIRLVLFPTGQCVAKGDISPAFARAHGHYVYNHSVSHPDLTKLSKARVVAELGSPGVQGAWGRPPFGAVNATVRAGYAAKGMRIWLWDLDTNDWRGKSTDEVVAYVVTNAAASDTVLMHMKWNGFKGDALARMKSGLAGRGLQVCRNTGPVAEDAAFAC